MSSAISLEEAYQSLDPSSPLFSADPYYVARPDRPLEHLEHLIRVSRQPVKTLVAGQRGVGKTTELHILAEHLSEQFAVVWIDAAQLLDLADVSVEDVLLAMAFETYKTAQDMGLELQPEIVEELQEWFMKQVEQAEYLTGVCTLEQLLPSLSQQVRFSTASRKAIRERIAPNLGTLVEQINLLIMSTEVASGGKKIVFIFDSLDRVSLDVSHRLFVEGWSVISAPIAPIIYVISSAFLFDPQMASSRQVDATVTVPNVTISGHDGVPWAPGFNYLRNVILKRLDQSLIDEGALELIIQASGGNLRELLTLMRDAWLQADIKNRIVISLADAHKTIAKLRMEVQKMLRPQDVLLLQRIHQDKRLEGEADLPLMHPMAVLEYHNDEAWYDVHPVLLPLLEEAW